MVRPSTLLTALWASTAASLRVRSVVHSGKGCPQDTKVSWSSADEAFVFTFHDFSETLAAGTTTACQVHVQIDEGEAGKTLLVEDATLRGGLYVSPVTKAEFLTVAFWSENASDSTSKESTIAAGAGPISRNVAVSQSLDFASRCVGSDGYVGILNVNFRIVAQGSGKVTFGRERGSGAPVTEVLKYKWQSC
ncbi:hypothetical protein VDGD_01213 [Verticillium dahliae]|nr:Histidyl-tRNA synthetase [Verticillium dahliae VDG1]RBQ93398.1 hypothetical protein VDGD_01213 [Verticillium dahliae]